MARVIEPPAPLDFQDHDPTVFLAGSIEMGGAEDWQREVCAALADLDVVILNPRRRAWDASWKQSLDEPRFVEQVAWELEGQERSSVIALYLAPTTRSPISLLELGLFARSGKLVVCCPEGFWRRGNVDIVCQRYGVSRARDLADLACHARARLTAPVHSDGPFTRSR